MSKPQTAAQGAPAPAAPPPAPVTPPAADPPAADPPAPPAPDAAWLAPRLEQAKRAAETAILAQLGVKDAAEAKAALDAYKTAQDAAKTEAERVSARIAEGDAAKARAATLEVAVSAHAATEMGKLDDAKRAAVIAIAGDDTAAQLRAISALAPTWSAIAPPATPPAVVTPPAAPPAAATTAHPPTAPAPANGTQSPVDHKSVFDALVTSGQGQKAAHYLNAHAREIYPER